MQRGHTWSRERKERREQHVAAFFFFFFFFFFRPPFLPSPSPFPFREDIMTTRKGKKKKKGCVNDRRRKKKENVFGKREEVKNALPCSLFLCCDT